MESLKLFKLFNLWIKWSKTITFNITWTLHNLDFKSNIWTFGLIPTYNSFHFWRLSQMLSNPKWFEKKKVNSENWNRKIKSTFFYSIWMSQEQWHHEDEINCHRFQVFLKVRQILKTRYHTVSLVQKYSIIL